MRSFGLTDSAGNTYGTSRVVVYGPDGKIKFSGGGGGGVASVTATAPIVSSGGANPNISIPVATALVNGYLSSADWTTFNGKQDPITLTTLGSSGASTFIANILNVPNYTLSGLGGVPTSRQLTINGTTFDLSADRTWSVGTVTGVTATGPITSSGGAAPNISTSMNTDRLIGRTTAGVGVMEEITVGQGLTLSAGNLSIDYGVITATTTNAREDDYAPVGWPGTNNVVKVIEITPNNTNNIVSIGGLTSGVAGRIVTIVNSATDQLLILDHNSPTSIAANRFKLDGEMSFFLMPGRDITFIYTGTRWSQFSAYNYAGLDVIDNLTAGPQNRPASGVIFSTSVMSWLSSGTASGIQSSGTAGNFDLGAVQLSTGTTSTGNSVGAITIRNGGGNSSYNLNGQFPSVMLSVVDNTPTPTLAQDVVCGVGYESTSAGWLGYGYIWKTPPFATFASVWQIDVVNTGGGLAVNVVTGVSTTVKQYLGIFNHGNNGNATFFSSIDGITYTSAYKFVRAVNNFAGYPKIRIASTVGTTAKNWNLYMLGITQNYKR